MKGFAEADVVKEFSYYFAGATAVPIQPAHGELGRLAAALRAGSPPVVVRVAENRLLIDLRTVDVADEPALRSALVKAASA